MRETDRQAQATAVLTTSRGKRARNTEDLVSKRRGRRVRLTLGVLSWALIAGFLIVFWPQSLGGPIAYVKVQGHSMDGTYQTGDLIVVRKQDHYSAGEIITYRIPKGEFGAGAQVIHRIIGGNGSTGFITKGDNKKFADDWHPRTSDVVGRSWIRVPGAGVWFSRLSQPLPMGVIVGGLTVFVMVLPRRTFGMVAKEIRPKARPTARI
jgi:signal peptidase